MDWTKYQNILDYVNSLAYLEGFSKQEKLVLRKFAKHFEFDPQSKSLFYIDKRKDGTFVKRLVVKEDEKARIFEECHSADFSGHPGRDNTIKKIRERYYCPDYYKDTFIEIIVSFAAVFGMSHNSPQLGKCMGKLNSTGQTDPYIFPHSRFSQVI